jgi:uncharacterized protein YqeY
MSILTNLQDEMKTALKAQDSRCLSAIRMLISAIKYVQVDKPDLDEAGMLAVLSKEAKKRREAIEAYTAAGRTEQAAGEQYELTLIEGYLPKQLTTEEIRAKLEAIRDQLAGKNMGEAMKVAMAELKGQAEGGVVSGIVRELL